MPNPAFFSRAAVLSALLFQASVAKNCTWIEDTDFGGGSYHPAGQGSGMTKEQCCAFCQKDPKCDFAVLAGPKMKVPGSCWLKSLGAQPFHRPGDTACCPEGMVCEPAPKQPRPTVKMEDKGTDYDCCNIFNATRLPPQGWRKRYPPSAPGIKATGRNDTVPAYNVSQCIGICTDLYYEKGVECRAAAWNSLQQQCYLKTGRENPRPKASDTSFLLGV
eukprot:SAG22_NODE_80_length_21788_cov_9.742542_13_plen_218_part_00